jgi:hypothetical protein
MMYPDSTVRALAERSSVYSRALSKRIPDLYIEAYMSRHYVVAYYIYAFVRS